ncbi:hypothetical protein BDZ45DRAFT_788025 [Acephala macrosclerotiorum]|nr:hypothetical protein BDZ45DRAFT_788025 [Acephala macrosclerotiorum]
MEKRLKKMQDRLNINILALLSNKQSRVLSRLNELLAGNGRSETNTQNKIDQLRADILSAVEQAKEQANSKPATHRANTFSEIGTKCLDLAEEGERVATVHKILRSLNFKFIKARQSAIKEAHKKTFDWIFEEVDNGPTPRPRFLSWLREGKGIYWVSGKAGSGKSTLMKLLYDHESTKAVLQAWAGREKLVTACYFFWSAGNDLQKSQQGLLQSFLFQILSQCPDLIPIACPSRCSMENLDETADVWTLQELIGCFEILSKQDLLSAKFCFFVDGLDEYDGEDTDIIKTLQDLIISSKVKICASSRPWNAFEKAFGKNRSQKLLLQDYTKEDIRLYVTETLEKNESFVTLSRKDPEYKQLIEDIVERAQGVFLWVYLVVRSLLRGLTDDNDISFMHERLDSLPVDLEDYFKQMMDTIEDIYRKQTARIFQLVVHAKSPLSAIAFWFFAKEKDNPNYAIEAEIKSLDDSEVGLISERMRTHLNACCKDLLEVNVDQSAGKIFQSHS